MRWRSLRELRFALLRHIVVPVTMFPWRALMRTWRAERPDDTFMTAVAAHPRVVFVLSHTGILQAFAFAELARHFGHRWLILATPSLDGRLAATILERVGARVAMLTSGVRGLEAAGAFVGGVSAGDWGIIVADGPRGPRGVVKAGVARTASAAGACVVAVGLAASRGVRFNSWDRPLLPAPFARVVLACRLVLPTAAGEHSAEMIQAALDAANEDARGRLAAARRRRPFSAAPTNP